MAARKRVLKSTRPHVILGSLLYTHGPLPGRKISLPPTQTSSSYPDLLLLLLGDCAENAGLFLLTPLIH